MLFPLERRLDFVGGLFVYVVAFLVRIFLWRAPAYGDEGLFFYTARYLAVTVVDQIDLYAGRSADLAPFFWYRPLQMLILWPGAQLGFAGFRLLNLSLAALLPLAAWLLLRRERVSVPIALFASGLVALHPAWVVWGVQAVPDTLLAIFLAAAWGLRRAGRPGLSWVALVLATWVKESGIVAVIAMLEWVLLQSLVRLRARPGLHLLREPVLGLVALPLALAPWLYGQIFLAAPPAGGPGSFPPLALVETLVLTAWLLPFLVLGLRWGRTRAWVLMALVYPAFYLSYGLGLGRFVHLWYFVVPTFFVVVSSAVVADEALRRASASRPVPRVAAVSAIVCAALLIGAGVFVPNGPNKGLWAKPLSRSGENSLQEAIAFEHNRDPLLWDFVARAPIGPNRTMATLDVYRDQLFYPFTWKSRHLEWVWSEGVHNMRLDPTVWGHALERADVGVLFKTDWGLNRATRDVYADCIVYENAAWVAFEAQRCVGRAQRLWDGVDHANAGP